MRKGNVNTSSPRHTHEKITKNFKEQVTQKWPGKEKNITLQITQYALLPLKLCLVIRQLAVHRGQLGLELLNLAVQATNCSKHSVFLGPLIQKQIVTTKIGNVRL